MTYRSPMTSRGTLATLVVAILAALTFHASPAQAGEHAQPVSVKQYQERVVLWSGRCVHERRSRVVKQYGALGYFATEKRTTPGEWSRWHAYRVDPTYGC